MGEKHSKINEAPQWGGEKRGGTGPGVRQREAGLRMGRKQGLADSGHGALGPTVPDPNPNPTSYLAGGQSVSWAEAASREQLRPREWRKGRHDPEHSPRHRLPQRLAASSV